MWPFKKAPKPPTEADRMRALAWQNRAELERRQAEHKARVEAEVQKILLDIEKDAKQCLYRGQYECDYFIKPEVLTALSARGFNACECNRAGRIAVSW